MEEKADESDFSLDKLPMANAVPVFSTDYPLIAAASPFAAAIPFATDINFSNDCACLPKLFLK